MAGKRKMAKISTRGIGLPKKDEGPQERFRVIDPQGEPIYLKSEEGLTLIEAVRLASGLVTPGGVAQIGPDGNLYPGWVDNSDPFEPSFTPVTPVPEPEDEEEE